MLLRAALWLGILSLAAATDSCEDSTTGQAESNKQFAEDGFFKDIFGTIWRFLESSPLSFVLLPTLTTMITSAPVLAITGLVTVLWGCLDRAVYTRATIYSDTEAFDWLSAWIARQPAVVQDATNVEVQMDAADSNESSCRWRNIEKTKNRHRDVTFRPAKDLRQPVCFVDSSGVEHDILIERKSEVGAPKSLLTLT